MPARADGCARSRSAATATLAREADMFARLLPQGATSLAALAAFLLSPSIGPSGPRLGFNEARAGCRLGCSGDRVCAPGCPPKPPPPPSSAPAPPPPPKVDLSKLPKPPKADLPKPPPAPKVDLSKAPPLPNGCGAGKLWLALPTPHCIADPCQRGQFYTPLGCIKGDVNGLMKCMSQKGLAASREVKSPQALISMAQQRTQALFDLAMGDLRDLFRHDPKDRITDGKSAMAVFARRLDRAGTKDPALFCLAAFVKPALQQMGPQIDALAAATQGAMQHIWKDLLEKQLQEAVQRGITQSAAVVVGEDTAKTIIAKQVAAHLYDLSRIEAATAKIAAVTAAVTAGGDVAKAVEELKAATDKEAAPASRVRLRRDL